jgi:hypothetical protein
MNVEDVREDVDDLRDDVVELGRRLEIATAIIVALSDRVSDLEGLIGDKRS